MSKLNIRIPECNNKICSSGYRIHRIYRRLLTGFVFILIIITGACALSTLNDGLFINSRGSLTGKNSSTVALTAEKMDRVSVPNNNKGKTQMNQTPADIVAHPGNAVPLYILGPEINYATLGNTSCLSDRILAPVTITDPNGVNIAAGTRPRLYYRKTSNTNSFNDNTNLTDGWKYVEATGTGGSPFSFTTDFSLLFGGIPRPGDVVEYFVVAQDLSATPVVGINSGAFAATPTSVALTAAAFPIGGTINSYALVSAGLSGTVSVGPSESVKSLTAAGGLFSIINTDGLSDNLLVNITGNIIIEDGTNALNAINYNGCTAGPYTLTIKPAGTFSISGDNAGALIKINGADHVIIDGSTGSTANSVCPSVTATRDLTISNSNPGTSGAVVWLQTNGTDGATDNLVKNCNIVGNATTTTLVGIGSGSSTISTGSLGMGNNNNTFWNNNIKAVQVGIYSQGASAANKNTGNIINQNVMNATTGYTPSQNIGTAGILVGFENNITISGNTIASINGSSADGFGIACGGINISTFAFTGNEVINATITNNKIDSVRGAATFSAGSIFIATSTNAGINLVANNTITNAGTNGSSGEFGAGILIGGGAVTTNIYFNSISMSGMFTGGSQPNFAMAIGGTDPIVNIRNNALSAKAVTGSATTLGLGEYAIGYNYSTFTNLTVNNNDYFTSGAESKFAKTGSLAAGSGTDIANLAALQAAIPGQDLASISANPLFAGLAVLQPVPGSPLLLSGTPAGSITSDITCVTRSVSTPTIGAYEQAGDFTPPVITYTALTNTLCPLDRTLPAVTITDPSGVNIIAGTRPRLYYRKTTNANTFNDNTSGTDGWKYVEATGSGGSPFSFTTNYSLLFGGLPIGGDIIQYFVVAQDGATTPNVGINSGTFALTPASVALTAAAFPVAGSINSFILIATLSGSVNVGPGETYTTLSAAGGLFAAINAGGLSGNVTANITGNITTEDGVNALNAISYGCAGTYTLTIKPTGAFTVSGSSTGAMIRLNAADNVIIDGSAGSVANTICPVSAASRDLTITNTNTGMSGAVIWLQNAGADGATNNTIKNCNIIGNSTTTTLAGIGSGSSVISTASLGAGNNTNSFVNNFIRSVQVGIYSQGASAANKNTGNIINQNVMNAQTGFTPSQNIRIAGILVGFENNITISGNTIASVSGATLDGFGIACGGSDITTSTYAGNEVINATVTNNKIDSIRGASTFSVAGIFIAPSINTGINLVANNTITNAGTNGTSGDFGSGIFIGGGAVSTNIYFNSVSISGTSWPVPGEYPNFALAIGGTNPVVNIRDNVLTAKAVLGSATTLGLGEYAIGYSYSTFTNLTQNNNDYFTSGAEAKFAKSGSLTPAAGADISNLAALQAATGQDALSISADPLFSSLFLLQPQTGSPLLNAGVPAGSVANDILCISRNITTPGIGAYENTVVGSPPSIIYTILSGTCATGNRVLTATITDALGVPVTGLLQPRIYYKKNAGPYFSSQGVLSSGTATNGVWTFTIVAADMGGIANPDVISYFVIAQNVAPIPAIGSNPSAGLVASDVNTVTTPPTSPNTYSIQNILAAGTYTVGTAGNYPTLTAAIASYNNSCLAGAVVFELLNASYTTPAETFPVTINTNADASAVNNLTIRPAAGITPVFTAAVATGPLIRIQGKYITIDGSNNGTTTRNLTMNNTGVTTPNVLLIGSVGTTPVTNVTVKNCILINGINSSSALVTSDANTVGNAGYFNNITIQNNSVQLALTGIFINAVIAVGNGSGLLITGNNLNTAGANSIRQVGIYVQGVDGGTISNNTIANVVNTVDPVNITGIWLATAIKNVTVSGNTISTMSGTAAAPRGIAISSALAGANINITGNTITGLTSSSTGTTTGIQLSDATSGVQILRNNISNIKNTNTAGWGCNGIWLNSTSNTAATDVINNVVYDVASYGFDGITSTDNGYGILVNTGGGYNIRFNSIRMTTDQTDITGRPAAINISSGITTTASLDIRDNIFANTQTLGNRYAVVNGAANTVFSSINYNDYFSTSGTVGWDGVTAYPTLASWQTFTTQDANSVSVDPLFTNTTNLALNGASPVIGGGVTIGGITTDYTNSTRNAIPSIGAYENKIVFSAKIWLSGAYSTALSRHKNVTLIWRDVLRANATTQPYGTLTNNFGPTTVASTIFTNDDQGGAVVNGDIVDWVLVDLRDAAIPNTIIAQRAAFVREDGLVVDVDGVSPVSFKGLSSANYFIDIRHRNHLSVRTALVQTVNGNAAAPAAYDFTTALASARDSAANLVNRAMKDVSLLVNGTAWGLWGGNGNGNNNPVAAGFKTVRANGGANVLVNDYTYLINTGLSGNAATPVTNVYHNADYNMDGTIRANGGANPLINDYTFLVNYILGGNASLIITQHQ